MHSIDEADIVVIGPGPGDINDTKNERMLRLRKITSELLRTQTPVLGVCLGLQAVAKALGIPVKRQAIPSQGIQKEIDLFGSPQKVGMYNSFSPINQNVPEDLMVSTDNENRVMALKRENLFGMQFHAESAMTQNGFKILSDVLAELHVEKAVQL